MEIREGRHPVIEQMLKGSLFVPNDTLLDEEENRMLLLSLIHIFFCRGKFRIRPAQGL